VSAARSAARRRQRCACLVYRADTGRLSCQHRGSPAGLAPVFSWAAYAPAAPYLAPGMATGSQRVSGSELIDVRPSSGARSLRSVFPLIGLSSKYGICWYNSARAQLRLCTTSASVGGWGLWISPFKQMCLANGALRKGSAFDTQPSSGSEVGGGPRTRLARPIVGIAISSQKWNLVL